MANPYIGLVNAQMLAVRHHLGLLLEARNASERLRNRCVLESAVWHLKRAYECYLFEVGANYQLKTPEDSHSAAKLGSELTNIGKHPGEASELLSLEENGWVADLLGAYQTAETGRITSPKSASNRETAPSNFEGLTLVNLDDVAQELSKEAISGWLEAFKELVDRQRTLMVEY